MPSSAGRIPAVAVALLALAACNGVQIKPTPDLPQPVIAPIPAEVGVVIPGDVRNYKHSEVRWGISWTAELGPGHVRWAEELFRSGFRKARLFGSLDEARAAPGLLAIFEPRIEQFSFTTARETGRHYAVTIRYRIGLFAPDGTRIDTFTLTGYGNSLPRGASSTKPLDAATLAAMRDAAAKFLVQFPEQSVAKQIAGGQPLVAAQAQAAAAMAEASDGIETVPLDEELPEPATESGPPPSGEEAPRPEDRPAPEEDTPPAPVPPAPSPTPQPGDERPGDERPPPIPPPPVPEPPIPG